MNERSPDTTQADAPERQSLGDPTFVIGSIDPAGETLCVVCGYDLRGLVHGAPCPECSANVIKTTDRIFAAFSSNSQIRQISIFLLLILIAALPIFASAALTTIGLADRSRQAILSRRSVVVSIIVLGLSIALWHATWFAFTLILKPRIEVIEPRGDSFRLVRKITLALLPFEISAALTFTLWLAGLTGTLRTATNFFPAMLYELRWFTPIVFGAFLMQVPALLLQADILGRFSHGLPQPERFERSRRDAAAAKPLALFSIIPILGIVLQFGAIIALMMSAWRARRVLRTLDLGA